MIGKSRDLYRSIYKGALRPSVTKTHACSDGFAPPLESPPAAEPMSPGREPCHDGSGGGGGGGGGYIDGQIDLTASTAHRGGHGGGCGGDGLPSLIGGGGVNSGGYGQPTPTCQSFDIASPIGDTTTVENFETTTLKRQHLKRQH